MLPRSRRGFQADNSGQDRVRTHLLFSSQAEHHTAKRKRRPHNKFHQMLHKKDEMVQANPDELDPSQWTGNQRILHFGPMAQRDPFFYYYPKGWDILYPAQFGFFPYRTNKFRGNSTVVCVWAFGIFFLLGGALMVYLGYFWLHQQPFWMWSAKQKETQSIPPIQIAGPILFGAGVSLTVLGLICSITTSQFLNEKLRYYHHRGQPASVTVYTTHFKSPRAFYETNPYQPLPPPAYPIFENRHANSSILSPHAELKLYPPVMPGHSTLSLHGCTPSFVASPYNTLRAVSVNRFPNSADPVLFNSEAQRASSIASQRQSIGELSAGQSQRRAKSVGASVQRTPSNRSR